MSKAQLPVYLWGYSVFQARRGVVIPHTGVAGRLGTFSSLLCGLLICTAALAQTAAVSQISGTVQDTTGAVLPAAQVRVTQTDTGLARSTVSGADGAYTISNLPVGPYQMQVNKDGFSPYVQSGIVLQVDSSPVINPVLRVGSVSET